MEVRKRLESEGWFTTVKKDPRKVLKKLLQGTQVLERLSLTSLVAHYCRSLSWFL